MKLTYEYQGKICNLVIPDYELNPMKLRFIKNADNDEELEQILYNILKELNTSILCNGMQLTNTKYPNYIEKLSLFKYYAKKLKNQFIYNNLINELIELHIKNLEFDSTFVANNTNSTNKTKKTNKSNKKKLPLWIKQESKDLFDSKPMYIYTNTKTNEIIESHNPNLIEEELSKKKKVKVKKEKIITGNILFSFKLK